MAATWPAVRVFRAGPFLLRIGEGGGKRVSSATLEGPWGAGAMAALEAAERAMERPLFRLAPAQHPGDREFDAALEARGYRLRDPSVVMAARVASLAAPLPPLAAFAHWPPLQIQRDIWEECGVGPARQAVMARAAVPKAALLARLGDRAAGAAFVACHGGEAMIHAVAVRPALRRQGVGGRLLAAAANWAAQEGATRLSLAVGLRNAAACALYQGAGMAVAGQYHYRVK